MMVVSRTLTVVLTLVALLLPSAVHAQEAAAADIAAQIDVLEANDENTPQRAAVRYAAMRELIAMGRDALPALIEQTGHASPNVRAGVATVLGKIGDEQAYRPLLSLFGDLNAEVRSKAAEALGWLKETRAVDPLLNLLESTSESDRRGAAVGLGNVGDPAAVPALIKVLAEDTSWEARWRAAVALGRIGDHAAAQALADARRDQNAVVSACAYWAGGAVIGTNRYDELQQNLDSDQAATRAATAWALGVIGTDHAVQVLIQAAQDEDAQKNMAPRWVLNWLGTPAALEALEKLRTTPPPTEPEAPIGGFGAG